MGWGPAPEQVPGRGGARRAEPGDRTLPRGGTGTAKQEEPRMGKQASAGADWTYLDSLMYCSSLGCFVGFSLL